MNVTRTGFVFATLAACFLGLTRAYAQAIPPPVALPDKLSLDECIQILRAHGLDVLLAEAQVTSAEGDVGVAGAVPNPAVSLGYGRVLPPSLAPGPGYEVARCPDQGPGVGGCSSEQYTVGLSDQAALLDSVSGKRGLRLDVAQAALAAAKMSRADALRVLQFQVKTAYLQAAQAQRGVAFAKQNQGANVRTLELFRTRLRSGAINEGEVARIETQKLEADQAADLAAQTLRVARYGLAFLLGTRGPVPEFTVDDHVLDFTVPAALSTADLERLLRSAFEHRPDLVALGYERVSAEAAIALAKRQRFPDITLSAQYTQIGVSQNSIQPPTVSFAVSLPVPLFYQQQGEIRRAEASYATQSLQQAKTTAQVVNDVSGAVAAFETSRTLVERMETALRPAAERAFQITHLQYDKGASTLMDFLDAQRTYTAINIEYLQDLTNYWTAVYQLEEAIGMELQR
ncbi:MAG: TolC family protein [Myxococcota bacterium]|nr:TolC family protein [Myxococcota bacterium]